MTQHKGAEDKALLFVPQPSSVIYRVRLKKMTQYQKCDYSVTHDNFCATFCTLVGQGPVH